MRLSLRPSVRPSFLMVFPKAMLSAVIAFAKRCSATIQFCINFTQLADEHITA